LASASKLNRMVSLPKDVAAGLKEYGLTPWSVTRRIIRMNDKLDKLIGQKVAEKRGKGWALTTFQRQAWGTTKEELSIESCVFMIYYSAPVSKKLLYQ